MSDNLHGGDSEFRWTRPVRALVFLLLHSYGAFGRIQFELKGGTKSFASSLATAMRHRSGERRSWIENMFLSDQESGEIPKSLFEKVIDNRNERYSVRLGIDWGSMGLTVELDGEELEPSEYSKISNLLSEEKLNLTLSPIKLLVHRPASVGFKDATNFPLTSDDFVRIEVKASRPAYLYVFWITGSGETQALYPWFEPGQWGSFPAKQKPADELKLPPIDGAETGWKIEQEQEGIETVIVAATPSSVSANVFLDGEIFQDIAMPQRLPKLERCRHSEIRRDDPENEEMRLNFNAEMPADSIGIFHRQIGDALRHFQMVRIVSCWNEGKIL